MRNKWYAHSSKDKKAAKATSTSGTCAKSYHKLKPKGDHKHSAEAGTPTPIRK